jgi:hypothetical protein
MKKILLLCLLAAGFAMAAKKNVAVFSCFDDGSLDDGDLKKLSFKIEEIGHEVLDKSGGFAFISRTKLAEKEEKNKEVIFKGCDEKGGTCLAKITKDANADFGTWCQIYKDREGFTLLFNLYDNVENISYKPKMFEHLRNADDALEKISKEISSSFREMLKDIAKACKAKGKGWIWENDECKSDEETRMDDCYKKENHKWRDGVCKSQEQIDCENGGKVWIGEVCKTKEQVECEKNEGRWENSICKTKTQIEKESCEASGRNYVNGKCEAPVFVPPSPQPAQQGVASGFVASVTTTPPGAALLLNGKPPQGCLKTPCSIQTYDKEIRLTASLSEYKTADTTFTITQPNQQVTIKLEPKDYTVYFESDPSGVLLSFNGQTYRNCQETPCNMEFKKGTFKVSADPNSELYEPKDTTIIVSADNQRVYLSLNGKFGTLDVKSAGGWNLSVGSKWYNSLNDVKLLPGTYKAKLTDECYEDIDFDVEINRGENFVFDASDKIEPKKNSLSLSAKYKGREQNLPVFIEGKEAGNTPFKSIVPRCATRTAEFGKDKINVDLSGLRRGDFEYTYNMPTWKATLLSVALGTIGAVLLYNAYSYSSEVSDYMDEYNKLDNSFPLEYDRLRKKANDAHDKVPIRLISGGVLVVSAVGVYLWF